MTDPDDPQPPAPRRRRDVALLLLGPLLRLALAVGALWAIASGGERILAGAGYLVAGLLVWAELARAGRGRRTEDDEVEE